jgi:hypothetical protein
MSAPSPKGKRRPGKSGESKALSTQTAYRLMDEVADSHRDYVSLTAKAWTARRRRTAAIDALTNWRDEVTR